MDTTTESQRKIIAEMGSSIDNELKPKSTAREAT